MAQQTLQESLMDLRLARYLDDWQSLSDRLTRVKKAVFESQNDEQFREALQNPCRVRLILLGAQSQEAETISKELVESVIGLRTAGEWKPDATSRPWQNNPNSDIRLWGAGHDEQRDYAAVCWKLDGQKLKTGRAEWSKPFEDDELRAFAERPPADPFVAAQEFGVYRRRLARVSPLSRKVRKGFANRAAEHASKRPPDPFVVAQESGVYRHRLEGFVNRAVKRATKHVQNLFFSAKCLIHLADDPSNVHPEQTDRAARSLDELAYFLLSAWASKPLLRAMHRSIADIYRIASVVKPSVHEAVEETAHQVYFAFQNAIRSEAFHDSREQDRFHHGPWHGHEVRMALATIHEKQAELRSVFESVSYQSHEANLRRESARLLSEVKDVEEVKTVLPSKYDELQALKAAVLSSHIPGYRQASIAKIMADKKLLERIKAVRGKCDAETVKKFLHICNHLKTPIATKPKCPT